MLPICYNGFVRSARFFLLPAVALAEEGALPPMLARHVVPLTPLVSVRPIHSVSSKQCADDSPQIPFFVFKNLRTLSFSVSCNSFTCHYYEDCWVCTNNSHSGTHLPDHDDHPCCFFSNTYEMQISQLFCFHIHANWGGCTPWRFYSPNTPLAGKARNLSRPHPAFGTSLHLCFIASFFHYNRCASIRGRNEFPPAFRRNPHRLRAPLLGRQHHGALRASLVLRRVCLFGPLPSRSPQLSDGARHEFDRALWRAGMVPGDLRRRDRRPARIPPRPLSGLSDPRRLVLLAWFDRFFVACAGEKLFATGSSGDDSSRSAALGGRTGEALRGRYDRAGLPGECPLHRLLHLLHFGEHRRRDRTLAGRINQRTSADSHRVPDGGAERLPNVFRRARVLQGTPALRRNKYREQRRDAGQFRQGAGQSQIHGIFADFFRLLDCLLAGIHFPAALRSRLHQSRNRHGSHAFNGAAGGDCAHRRYERGHKENGAFQRGDPWHSHFHGRVCDSGDSLQRDRRLCHAGGCRARRDNSGAALLRLHLAPRSCRTARHLHGFRIPAHWHRLAHWRMVWRPHHAPVRRSRAPASARLVGHFRRGNPDGSAALDLRPRRQTIRAGGVHLIPQTAVIFWRIFSCFELSTVDCQLFFNSPCGGWKRAPAAPPNSAARFPAPLGNSASRGYTFLFPDTPAPGRSAGSGAARSGALPWRVPARGSLPRNGPARSGTRRCRCKGCRTPGQSRSRACTPQWLLRCVLENDTSSQETCALRPSDAAPMTIDTVPRRDRSRLPSAPDKRLAGLPMPA